VPGLFLFLPEARSPKPVPYSLARFASAKKDRSACQSEPVEIGESLLVTCERLPRNFYQRYSKPAFTPWTQKVELVGLNEGTSEPSGWTGLTFRLMASPEVCTRLV